MSRRALAVRLVRDCSLPLAPQITVGSVGLEGRVDWRAHVRSKRLCMMHDFGCTESRIVLLDCPMARPPLALHLLRMQIRCLCFARLTRAADLPAQTFGLVRSAMGGHPFEYQHGGSIWLGFLPRAEGAKSDPQKPAEVSSGDAPPFVPFALATPVGWHLPKF